MTCMKQEFCIHEKYCQRHIGQNFDSCILFSRNSKPMTNEEWFCQLSTEEKAEWLEEKMTWAAQEQGTFTAKGWANWLKEKRNEM